MLGFDKATYLTLLIKFISSLRLINSFSVLDVLLFLKFIDLASFFMIYLYLIHYIVKSIFSNFFAQYKEYMICLLYYLLLIVQELLVIFEAFV